MRAHCMAERIKLSVDGRAVEVPAGAMVSAAVAVAGASRFRRSVMGEPRAPLCGMGICFECRVTIDGRAYLKSCQIPCEEGMEVRTDG
jgi:D-hydroxyproline dehydrogenase subunit gamma